MDAPDSIAGQRGLLFVAHPGHELLMHRWTLRTKPVVCILTDGSGFDGSPRISRTERWLRSNSVPVGGIFGRFSDREAYTAILSGEVSFIDDLVTDLTREIVTGDLSIAVADAAEGFNPVHDLCQLIAGAATSLAALAHVRTLHCEYPIHDGPGAFDGDGEGIRHLHLEDSELAEKLADAHDYAEVIPDIQGMISEFGEDAFRRESFRPVADWTAWPWPSDESPLYERIGKERVARKRYDRVIGLAEHMQPLLEHLRERVRAARVDATLELTR